MGIFFLLCPLRGVDPTGRSLKYGPFLGRFKMVYCAIILRIIRSAYINHFETPTNLSYMRLALARSLWNNIWSLYYFSVEFYLLMPYKPACHGATGCGYATVFTAYECLTFHHRILTCQVWARGKIKKKIPIPWILTLPCQKCRQDPLSFIRLLIGHE